MMMNRNMTMMAPAINDHLQGRQKRGAQEIKQKGRGEKADDQKNHRVHQFPARNGQARGDHQQARQDVEDEGVKGHELALPFLRFFWK
jgi:hypothetical protein